MNNLPQAPIPWFRNMAPYIHLHRGATFVITVPGEVQEKGALTGLLHDLALLSSLGVRLVVVHGSRPQIDRRLAEAGMASELRDGRRVTPATAMPLVQQAVGAQRIELEALLSMGLPSSPMAGANLKTGIGNFITAQPLGVVDGLDHQFTGKIRRIDGAGIENLLDHGRIVLVSPLGYSPTGEVFNLEYKDVAIATAEALGAGKLILLGTSDGIHDEDSSLIRQITAGDGARYQPKQHREAQLLHCALEACRRGVPRTHIVSYTNADALLTELFTTDGSGTLVTSQPYEQSRWATINDVGGILELITPLEESGVLLKRSRERLEAEIGRFRLLERDGRIIACAALYPFGESGSAELACIVSDPEYRGERRARRLLEELENEALNQGLSRVFVLTTQTAHWFIEQGFREASLDTLPEERQSLYNLQRNSKVFVKNIERPC
ncbi:MAG: amino-acid N-acetyltransferase [Pseudomonadota bacterium]